MKSEEGRVKNPMEVKSEERGSDGSEGKCDNRVVANSTRRARFPISSSLKFFVLPSSLFPLHLNSSLFTKKASSYPRMELEA